MESIFDYYLKTLTAEKLKKVYGQAPTRIVQYLNAEVDFIKKYAKIGDKVLELGCGYGRVLKKLSGLNCHLHGIDNSEDSIEFAQSYLSGNENIQLSVMNALELNYPDNKFDLVFCIQNGISAFHVDQSDLIKEAIRITKPDGQILFSSYSDKFWDDRLRWFKLQAETGLLGEIDLEKTGDGKIVCKDGFTTSTVTEQGFRGLLDSLEMSYKLVEVDNSSLFCVIKK